MINLKLGGVTFEFLEVPAQLKGLGGKHQLAVTDFVGPYKAVQALGPKPNSITWTGIFTNKNALERARTVDYYRANATPVELVWASYLADVVVREFHYDPENDITVPYSITIEVVTDRTLPLNNQDFPTKDSDVTTKLSLAEDSITQLKANDAFFNQAIT